MEYMTIYSRCQKIKTMHNKWLFIARIDNKTRHSVFRVAIHPIISILIACTFLIYVVKTVEGSSKVFSDFSA